ncbi:MAG: hypothetical protein C3F02_02300 [Parcubacteria group bacterium]|nr:MAG: hypothetical protein C3F02_02300 [Parcubacteria group bacterium]
MAKTKTLASTSVFWKMKYMKSGITTKTRLGKWSVYFGLIFDGLMLISLLVAAVIKGESQVIEGNIFIPILSVALNLSGLLSLVSGLLAIFKNKDRVVAKYLAILYALAIIIFLSGEFLFPH